MRRFARNDGSSVLAGLALACIVLAGCGQAGASEQGAGAPSGPVAVHVATVRGRTRPVSLALDGTLLADEESRVTSVVAGRVREVLVERGSVVHEGDPMVRLRDVDYRLQADAARAQLDQARAHLGMAGDADAPPRPEEMPDVLAARSDSELADANLARSEELARRGVLSQQSLDEVRSRAASARERYQAALNGARASISTLAAARAALGQATTATSEATVRAPFDGEIAERFVSVGEYVTPQTPLVTLVRTDPLRIEVDVPQQRLSAVHQGQTIAVEVDAIPDRTFEGTVRYVSAAVSRDTRSLTVEAVVENPDRVLRPGLFARARLETGTTEDVAVVPPAAVYTQAGVDRAFVVSHGTIEERLLTVLDRSDEEIIVGDGLSPHDRVAVDHLDELSDGQAVTVASGE